ncbi:hypothetical protein D6D29_03871 [Aureobasidium pullulans]|nr:hypothetical protein D6D29_03871 [Aureobasidium pullulans]THW02742.1 hypothetical protein D6D26_04040 [Aureobasidium pullulans]THW64179.1 hypothetical protein D6D20_03104 [Aureobasidium pullulans]THY28619.1 hypothetical protein D6D00_04089 [Aureobasidium pullulans]
MDMLGRSDVCPSQQQNKTCGTIRMATDKEHQSIRSSLFSSISLHCHHLLSIALRPFRRHLSPAPSKAQSVLESPALPPRPAQAPPVVEQRLVFAFQAIVPRPVTPQKPADLPAPPVPARPRSHRNMTASAYLSVLAAMLALAVGAVYMFGVPPQWKRAMEEKALETMGENKASYLVKDQINSLPATDQKDVNQLKSGVGNLVGGALQNPLGKEAGNVGDTITSPLTGR